MRLPMCWQKTLPRGCHRMTTKNGCLGGYKAVGQAAELYCIVLYLLPVLNPKSYDGARVLEASGRPMLVIGRSYVVSIQVEGVEAITGEMITKLAEETTEKSDVEEATTRSGTIANGTKTGATGDKGTTGIAAGTKLIA